MLDKRGRRQGHEGEHGWGTAVTRLYLPATLQDLAVLDRVGAISVGDDVVVAPDESEEAEYAALITAAELSAYLVAELAPGQRRRVVIVAETAGIAGTVRLSDVVAVHADAGDIPSGIGRDDVEDLDDLDDLDDLGWYATQEIPDLLR
jgi:hypothetical protein